MIYSVVLLDGKELHCLSHDEVKDLFFKRKLNQDSLCCSAENPQWQMLKRAFDLSQWVAAAPAPQINPFEQAVQPHFQNEFNKPSNNYQQTPAAPQENPSNQFVTFNQFPQNGQTQPQNPYAPQNASHGYSQNNQTETYYQAETTQTNYNFQNNQASYTPSKYSNPANSFNYSQNFQPQSSNVSGKRRGLQQSAAFLMVNLILYVGLVLLGAIYGTLDGDGAEKFGQTIGGLFIPVVVDLLISVKLWKLDDEESARKWGLARAYYSLIVFGLIVPMACFSAFGFFAAAFSFVSAILFYLSVAITLHGKQSPATGRLVTAGAVFALYFVFICGTMGLSLIGKFAPEIAKLDSLKTSQFDKYKVEGKEFQDKTTGAKVVLPEGWSMISLDNPLIHTPEARMIAIDKTANRLTMLEVVPVPGNLDMKRQNSSWILDQISDGVVKALKEQVQRNAGFGENSFREITRLSIFVGTHPAKLLVFDKTENGVKAKGHLIITYDELTFYVLHSWCPAEEYETAQNDFKFFEQNFHVPEKINSTFTQTAETQKK